MNLNPGLPPFKCASCERDAVCGLYQKSQPELVVNVCACHFRKMTGRKFDRKRVEDEARQRESEEP